MMANKENASTVPVRTVVYVLYTSGTVPLNKIDFCANTTPVFCVPSFTLYLVHVHVLLIRE